MASDAALWTGPELARTVVRRAERASEQILSLTRGFSIKDVSTRAASLYRKKACFWVACFPPARSLATADTVPGQMPRGLERARFRRSQTAM